MTSAGRVAARHGAHTLNWRWRGLGLGTRRGEGARQAPGCLSCSGGEGTKRSRSFLFCTFVEHPRAGTPRSAGPAPYRAAGSLSSIDGKAVPLPPCGETELGNLNKRPPHPACARGKTKTLKRPANRSQINKGNHFRRDWCNRLNSYR